MIIRKAEARDLDAIESIYNKILLKEEESEVTTGWERGIYPRRETAEAALKREDMFVIEDDGAFVGAGIINKEQVDVYAKAKWKYSAEDSEVMVLHTLVIDPDKSGMGYGKRFVDFYEDYTRENGCKYLRMDTNERNKAARNLYTKLGFNEIDCLPCIFNGLEGVNLILFEKKL
ncbi:GNAT family N-acetyltransferase [Peptoniphilus sp. HMSC062D09]|uniref:GNAT family N-acetyltransferase n=1 Tax=Peptoniphilus sp. HMSC062D09 TaxID=1739305 RepID=UPI0008A35676|nr:GNAT family N-acetyltransferase [Peptoniphilus sp. HMSC062D09]OFK83347.1 GNAT family acetyltransferase [Peptoniphilus sp. HMSC062D09]